ncbi:MAG: gamma-glutamyl-gamma-aminobutyrate hydrolase family protein, partial [Acidimicrobiales bacterium]
MTAAPLIGLTGRRKSASKIEGTAGNLQHLDGDWYYADYARGILQAGGLPVHLPMDVDPRRFVDRLDGVILTGGSDVGPAHYGAVNEFEEHNHVESDRDELELTLYAGAIAAGLPVLGICRGLQVINVGGGGTLHQHVPEHSRYDIAAH